MIDHCPVCKETLVYFETDSYCKLFCKRRCFEWLMRKNSSDSFWFSIEPSEKTNHELFQFDYTFYPQPQFMYYTDKVYQDSYVIHFTSIESIMNLILDISRGDNSSFLYL